MQAAIYCQEFFVQPDRRPGIVIVGNHVIDAQRVGFPLLIAVIRRVDEINAESGDEARGRHACGAQSDTGQRAERVQRIRTRLPRIYVALRPVSGFVTDQRRILIGIIGDQLDHANVDGNDSLSVIGTCESVGLIAFDNIKLAVHVGRPADSQVSQRQLLNGPGWERQNNLFVWSLKIDRRCSLERHVLDAPREFLPVHGTSGKEKHANHTDELFHTLRV